MVNPQDLGHLIEGVVEQDPMTDRYVVRIPDFEGKPAVVDLQDLLAPYKGKEVRLTLASLENLARLAKLAEEAGAGGQVFGIGPDQLPD